MLTGGRRAERRGGDNDNMIIVNGKDPIDVDQSLYMEALWRQVNAWYSSEDVPVTTTHLRHSLSVMENPFFHFGHLCGDCGCF